MEFELIPVSKDSSAWQCCLLKCGGLTVLLNCGWTDSLDAKLLTPLLPHLASLDLVLLTHADIKHMGAIPYILSKFDVTCPVVCTEPVNRIGELVCVACLEDREKYQSESEDLDVDDILRVFMSRLTPLKYHEPFSVQGKNGRTLIVCPYPAGGQLGSTFWTLQCGNLSALYMVDFELRRGRYLDGLELDTITKVGASQRWDLVITSLPPAISSQLPRHGALNVPDKGLSATSKALTVASNIAEQHLLQESISTLRKGGSVLIPVDAVGKVPDILLLFEAAWEQDRQLATNYPLVWLSSVGDMVLDQIKTRLEFMSKQVLEAFELGAGQQNPFLLKYFKIFPSLEELLTAHPISKPKVVLATSPHLEGGDSRELFMRLCSDQSALIWLLGVPPKETLARQLLEDFVVKQGTRKDYRMQQYSKQPLPEEQLRAFYEAKVQELAETGQRYSMMPEVAPKIDTPASKMKVKAEAFDFEAAMDSKAEAKKEEKTEAKKEEKLEKQSLKEVKEELKSQATPAPKFSDRDESKLEAKLLLKEATRAAAGTLWAPFGWPSCRTMSHWEGRCESDEYGHILLPAELKAWRSQDQEGNKYSFGFIDFTDNLDAKEEEVIKDETKTEEDLMASKFEAPEEDWREQMRLHFHEPMQCEVRDRMVRVACRVRLFPTAGQETKDIYALLQTLAPKRIVLLPTAGESTLEVGLARHLKYSQIGEGVYPPEVYSLNPHGPSPKFPVPSLKRKFQFESDTWKKLSFLKASENVRIARIRATTSTGSDPRMPELRSCEAPTGMMALTDGSDSAVANGADATAISTVDRLPRSGALFMGLGNSREAISLSGLKEHLVASEDFPGEIEFHPPQQHSKRPWSSRMLVAEGKAVIGWTNKHLETTKGADDKENGHERSNGDSNGRRAPVLRIEGAPCEQFFKARAALYKRCTLV
mmetsp:Transcript_115454/g.182526  ORF Transcript_115454/g.182526 Transcript_115454/m.182526 type:complete len:933 (-) Transcript_115454:46-2844(-)